VLKGDGFAKLCKNWGMRPNADLVLIYDGDCQFCRLSLDYGIRNLKNFPLYVAFQRINPQDFGLTQDQVRSQIWTVGAGKPPSGGHLAVAVLLAMQSNPFYRVLGWLVRTPPTSWLAKKLYFFIAANRHRLPGGSRECKLTDTYNTPPSS
jgi:predicted DCC family thiol-disulfide oxidoreductase YuxK